MRKDIVIELSYKGIDLYVFPDSKHTNKINRLVL